MRSPSIRLVLGLSAVALVAVGPLGCSSGSKSGSPAGAGSGSGGASGNGSGSGNGNANPGNANNGGGNAGNNGSNGNNGGSATNNSGNANPTNGGNANAGQPPGGGGGAGGAGNPTAATPPTNATGLNPTSPPAPAPKSPCDGAVPVNLSASPGAFFFYSTDPNAAATFGFQPSGAPFKAFPPGTSGPLGTAGVTVENAIGPGAGGRALMQACSYGCPTLPPGFAIGGPMFNMYDKSLANPPAPLVPIHWLIQNEGIVFLATDPGPVIATGYTDGGLFGYVCPP